MKTYFKLCVPLLLVTMACAFVQNMIFPPAPTAVPPTPSQTPRPAATETLPAEATSATVEPISCSDDDCLDACLDRLKIVLEAKPLEPITGKDRDKEYNLAIYKVNGDEISSPRVPYVPSEYRKYQEDKDAHLRIWNFYVAVIPDELRSTIQSFTIFTDGPDNATAWVSRPAADKEYSRVGIDLLDSAYPPYLANTLVHETAHLLTLNSSQVQQDKDRLHPYDEAQKSFFECEQYAADGGCSLPNSYINLFYQKFWKDIYAEWQKVDQEAQQTDSTHEYWQVIDRFYDKHSESFLDSYAATSVEEDMAESFAYFALNPKPSSKWIFQKKIIFFYDFPELVVYRRQIIEGLCSYIR